MDTGVNWRTRGSRSHPELRVPGVTANTLQRSHLEFGASEWNGTLPSVTMKSGFLKSHRTTCYWIHLENSVFGESLGTQRSQNHSEIRVPGTPEDSGWVIWNTRFQDTPETVSSWNHTEFFTELLGNAGSRSYTEIRVHEISRKYGFTEQPEIRFTVVSRIYSRSHPELRITGVTKNAGFSSHQELPVLGT